jgi:flagellar basal body-associated protein FliL
MKKNVKVLLIILGVILIIGVFAAVFMSQTNKNLEALTDIQIEDIDIAAIPDGTYMAASSPFPLKPRLP